MRVIVCGGRFFTNRAKLFDGLDSIHKESPITLLIHGACKGADMLADEWAVERGIERRLFKAEWRKFGGAAGPIRNMQMIREGIPDLVIAFPGGKGTADMVRQSEANGIKVNLM